MESGFCHSDRSGSFALLLSLATLSCRLPEPPLGFMLRSSRACFPRSPGFRQQPTQHLVALTLLPSSLPSFFFFILFVVGYRCRCRCFWRCLGTPQELLDNTAKLREQMAGARLQAEREQQEEYLRVKQMEAYERR